MRTLPVLRFASRTPHERPPLKPDALNSSVFNSGSDIEIVGELQCRRCPTELRCRVSTCQIAVSLVRMAPDPMTWSSIFMGKERLGKIVAVIRTWCVLSRLHSRRPFAPPWLVLRRLQGCSRQVGQRTRYEPQFILNRRKMFAIFFSFQFCKE